MKVEQEARELLAGGLLAIAKQYNLPSSFPPEVILEAERASRYGSEGHWLEDANTKERVDATHLPLVTLDPATSTDLDQAFALERQGKEIVLHYALADLSAFIAPVSPVESEAWQRGVTIYGLTEKVPLYPKVLSQGAASLLPDGPRPAVLVSVAMDTEGVVRLLSIQRVVCQSRAKLAYDQFDVKSVAYLQDFADRMWLDEMRRGAIRVEFPQQEVVASPESPGGVRLDLRARIYSELVNSTLSLAVNIAIGNLLQSHRTGLFRVMDEPAPRAIAMLRRAAHALGIAWSEQETLRDLQRRMDPNNITHQRFLLEARRAGGRAHYATFDPNKSPWHSAIGATYAHATAPLRRLADRYVLDLAYLLANNFSVPDRLVEQLSQLPQVMDRAEAKASNVDRAVIDLLEAVSLMHRVGEVLEAEVIDAEVGIVQTKDSAIRSKAANLKNIHNGQKVQVRIDVADPKTRTVKLSAV